MVTPPWMQAVAPRITEQAAPIDPMAAVLAELKALRAEVSGLRKELEAGRAVSTLVPYAGASVTIASVRVPLTDSAEAQEIASGYWDGKAA